MPDESATDHEYQFTTVDYSHSPFRVSVHLQMDYDEIVAGASIEVGDLVV